MTWYAGIDSGSWNTKAVVIDDTAAVLGTAVVRSGADLTAAADQVYAQALAAAGVPREEVHAVWATGFGRHSVTFAHGSRTELDCMGAERRISSPARWWSSTSAARTRRSSAWTRPDSG